MADLGKVVVTDGGNYSASVTYEKLTFVHYQGDAYMTLKTVKGVTPTDDGTNYKLFCKSAELATATKAGIVLPDGTTTTVDGNGKISVKKATTSAAGIVKPAATDFTMAADGTQKINTQFTQATELANIIAGEAIAQVWGKVSKAIATTMNLDQNALLKNMISNIAVNDPDKLNSAAYIYTLVERIGMGTELAVGANLTDGLNKVNSDLDDFKFYKSLEEIGITGTDFTHQAFVDLMPVNSLLLSFVTGLSFLPNTSSYILFVSCTGSSSSKRINFEATEAFGSARGVYKARYAAPAGTQWSGWERDLTNADYEAQNISNSYGLTINLFRFGNDNIKTIKIQGYINKALTAGTEYTIATNVVLKSRVNWYHNVLSGGKGSSSISYMNIDTSGNLKITPQTAIASGSAISIVEYYV